MRYLIYPIDKHQDDPLSEEEATMLVLTTKCLEAGHDCVRIGNVDSYVLICRTCRVAYDFNRELLRKMRPVGTP